MGRKARKNIYEPPQNFLSPWPGNWSSTIGISPLLASRRSLMRMRWWWKGFFKIFPGHKRKLPSNLYSSNQSKSYPLFVITWILHLNSPEQSSGPFYRNRLRAMDVDLKFRYRLGNMNLYKQYWLWDIFWKPVVWGQTVRVPVKIPSSGRDHYWIECIYVCLVDVTGC